MIPDLLDQRAVKQLEAAKSQLGSKEIKPLVAAQDEVLMRFQPLFAPVHLPYLTEAEFRSFLQFNNNHHWSGIHRQGPRMCQDMDRLRSALQHLTDADKPLAARYDQAVQSVPGMGKAVATAILHITDPAVYGVWNAVAESSLKMVEIWPNFAWGDSEGRRYSKLNERLVTLATTLHIDLWTLDALWWITQYNAGKK